MPGAELLINPFSRDPTKLLHEIVPRFSKLSGKRVFNKRLLPGTFPATDKNQPMGQNVLQRFKSEMPPVLFAMIRAGKEVETNGPRNN